MMKKIAVANCLLLFLMLVSFVSASDGTAADRFLGSPLLILVVLLAIDGVALAYHKLRK
jgi:hypothetical protein